jgi:hypothetical protein
MCAPNLSTAAAWKIRDSELRVSLGALRLRTRVPSKAAKGFGIGRGETVIDGYRRQLMTKNRLNDFNFDTNQIGVA